MEAAVSMVLTTVFWSFTAWDDFEDTGFFVASKRGGRPLLSLEPFPTAGGIPGSRRRHATSMFHG